VAVGDSHGFPNYFSRQPLENKPPAISRVKSRPDAGAQCSHDELARQKLELTPSVFIRVHPRGEVDFEKNKKKFSKRSEPSVGKLPGTDFPRQNGFGFSNPF
jgi:hypothetical protein